jgi:hypothetical protein
MKLTITPDMLFDSCRVLVLEECRAAEEDMLSLGIIIPDKAWLVLRGRMMSVVVEKAICTMQQMAEGKWDFSQCMKLTQADLAEWMNRTGIGIAIRHNPSRN